MIVRNFESKIVEYFNYWPLWFWILGVMAKQYPLHNRHCSFLHEIHSHTVHMIFMIFHIFPEFIFVQLMNFISNSWKFMDFRFIFMGVHGCLDSYSYEFMGLQIHSHGNSWIFIQIHMSCMNDMNWLFPCAVWFEGLKKRNAFFSKCSIF